MFFRHNLRCGRGRPQGLSGIPAAVAAGGILLGLSIAPYGAATASDTFKPAHRVSGIGIARDDISPDVLVARTNLMIESQTFSILREPEAVAGAKRITSPKLQSLFKSAAKKSGVPSELIEAIAYLESWGEAKAESPAGPKGIMQISGATARTMGLKVVTATRYKVTRERVPVKGKTVRAAFKTVTHRTPYTVTVRDDRLIPDRAVPGAAVYLAGMIRKFGGVDWAVFAYHCGQGCVGEMMELTRKARGIPKDELSVPRMFFSANPAWNRDLYEALQQQMQRDYSPTYYFRILRAQQLLALYRKNPTQFAVLAQQFRSEFSASANSSRAPHRLSVWLKKDDLKYRSCDLIRGASGKALARALDRPDYFGYALNITPDSASNLEYFQHASPSALGTLTYIAFETRRLYEATNAKEKFKPLPVTSLVETEEHARQSGLKEAMLHCSGEVFDIDYSGLPPREVEALKFVLSDLGWGGFLGFVEEGRDNLHIGSAPSSREFFTGIFQEATGFKVSAANGGPQ